MRAREGGRETMDDARVSSRCVARDRARGRGLTTNGARDSCRANRRVTTTWTRRWMRFSTERWTRAWTRRRRGTAAKTSAARCRAMMTVRTGAGDAGRRVETVVRSEGERGGDGDESDDAMMMDSDDEDWRAGESDSPIDLLGEEDEDEDEVNARMMRDIVAARERREGRSARDRIGFEGPSTFAPGVGGDFDLPEGIDREEAKMLEAAMLGVAYIPPDNRVPDYGASAPAPASVLNARTIANETDRAYQESLRADQEKEARARAEQIAREMVEAEKAEAEASEKAAREAEETARAKVASDAAEALPNEPAADEDGVVNIAFRLPDGSRVMRRFLSSHSARALFLFIDGYEKLHANSSRLAVEPGAYRLVAQHPRRVIESGDTGTIEEVGLTHKQEALMIELV